MWKVFRHLLSVYKRKGENAKSQQKVMQNENTSKRNNKKSLILQGIKTHRAKKCMVYGDQKKAKISS